MAPKIVDREEKKREIVMAAMEVFSEKGVANTKMIDIARAAGIGKGTIYEYFKNKDDIFINLFELHFTEIGNAAAEVMGRYDDPAEILQQFVEITVSFLINEDHNFAEIMLDIWAEGIREHNEEINRVFNLDAVYSQYRDVIIQILQDGVDKGTFCSMDTTFTASLFIGALDGILLQWLMRKDLFDSATLTDNFMKIFINGIKKEVVK
ncbi:MAG: TetR/AcrR family transcriptional regulator [Candidatus Cloacimonetes bacterium]|nr:TetR/AcrR family transcriptional regulator [Candidatus Cloacimonadota bacterium]